MSQIALESFGAYQKARQLFELVVADMETLKTNRRLHRRDAEDAEERAFDKHYSELCGLWTASSRFAVTSAPSTRPRRGTRALECVDGRGSSDE